MFNWIFLFALKWIGLFVMVFFTSFYFVLFFLFFFVPALLWDCSLCWDHWRWYRHLHLTQPCFAALGLVLIWDKRQLLTARRPAIWIATKSFLYWMIDAPYFDGIQTHRGRVKSVIRQPLYLQDTTAGLTLAHIEHPFSHVKRFICSKQKLNWKKA